MQDVVIYGCGGHGREMQQWLDDINADRPTFNLIGFLDGDTAKHGSAIHGTPVLGDEQWLQTRRAGVIIGIGAPAARRRVALRLRPLAAAFPIARHPAAVVGRHAAIGEGAMICPCAVVTTDVKIGVFACLNYHVSIAHDVVLGDFVTIAPGANLSGFTRVGDGCDLGAGAVTVPGVSIGEWSIVGAAASVTKDLPANCTAVGVPAKVIKTREPGGYVVP